MAERLCESRACDPDPDVAVVLVGVVCDEGHDRRRLLCQACFDVIWGSGAPAWCGACIEREKVPATLLEVVRVREGA